MTVLLGGAASPLGWKVQHVDAPFEQVLSFLVSWRQGLGQSLEVSERQPFPRVLRLFTPFQAPWSRELFMPRGTGTIYLNNSIDGGDLSASAPYVAASLGARWVGAGHTLPYGPKHQATQLRVEWVDGTTQTRRQRSIGVYQEDGRWSWEETGQPLPFEHLDRYTARRKRDRLDRELLLDYLEQLAIPASDDDRLGPGVVVQQRQHQRVQRREISFDEARSELGLPLFPV